MNLVSFLSGLEDRTFNEKVLAAIEANPVNEEQAAELLNGAMYAELKGALGTAAMSVLHYHDAKDWLQTLLVTAIYVVLQKREVTQLDMEGFFLEAWLDSYSTRALTEWLEFSIPDGGREPFVESFLQNVAPIITSGAARKEARDILRMALMRHVLLMAQKYPKLLVNEGLFAKLG